MVPYFLCNKGFICLLHFYMCPFIPVIFPVCCLFAFVSVIGFSQYFSPFFFSLLHFPDVFQSGFWDFDQHALPVTYLALNGLAPDYIKDLLKYNDSRRTLRSSNNRLLYEPRANLKTYGERAFSVAAPRLWNKLPLQIRLSSSEAVFKTNLKTHLLRRAFDL